MGREIGKTLTSEREWRGISNITNSHPLCISVYKFDILHITIDI